MLRLIYGVCRCSECCCDLQTDLCLLGRVKVDMMTSRGRRVFFSGRLVLFVEKMFAEIRLF